jgi:hypothetical protein
MQNIHSNASLVLPVTAQHLNALLHCRLLHEKKKPPLQVAARPARAVLFFLYRCVKHIRICFPMSNSVTAQRDCPNFCRELLSHLFAGWQS